MVASTNILKMLNMRGIRQVGDVVEGTVVTIQVYGAFVDLGNGLNGLLHVSQISHDRVSNVDSILKVGDRLKVCLITLHPG